MGELVEAHLADLRDPSGGIEGDESKFGGVSAPVESR